MFKLGFLLLAILAGASAKPIFAHHVSLPLTEAVAAAPVAYSAPEIVTATSYQYIARNHNRLVSLPYVAAAPAAAVASAPLVTSAAYSYAPAFVF